MKTHIETLLDIICELRKEKEELKSKLETEKGTSDFWSREYNKLKNEKL